MSSFACAFQAVQSYLAPLVEALRVAESGEGPLASSLQRKALRGLALLHAFVEECKLRYELKRTDPGEQESWLKNLHYIREVWQSVLLDNITV